MTARRSPAARQYNIGGLDHRKLQTLLGYNLAQASITTNALYEQAIGRELSLRQIEFSILILLDSNRDVTQKSLSLALAIPAPNLTIILDKLEKRQLIARVRSEQDRRAQLVCLTPQGVDLAARAQALAKSLEQDIHAHFSEAEWAMLAELLQRVALLRKTASVKTKA